MKLSVQESLIALLLGLLGFVGVLYWQCRIEASEATNSLLAMKAGASAAATVSVESARKKENEANENQAEVVAELQKAVSERDERIAALLGRVRSIQARSTGASGASHPQSAQASLRSDGVGDTGLRSVDGGNLVLTEASQEELARFAVSANVARSTLFACRKLLREAWQMSN